jgi:cation:H+ antiporter
MKFELPFCIAVSLLLTLLTFNFFTGGDAIIGRVDGIILLLCFALFMWYSLRKGRSADNEESATTTDTTPLWRAIFRVVVGLAVLITSCDVFVDNAVLIAKSLGVSDAFTSLTLIACGTSLPELAASMAATIKRNTQLALGNVIGSNIFNITWILGLSSQVMPLNSSGITLVDYVVMTIAAILPLLFGFRGKIGRLGGAMLFICFVIYTWFLLSTQI